ncbi:MAG TPA: hypothetical protein ENI53_02470, partial [Thermoplasmatales archaeon]|nr:hypothetical protein [Thermoplasmatales archaeon]
QLYYHIVVKEYLKLSRSFNAGLTAIAPVLGALSNGEENLFYLFLFFLVGFFGHCYGFALNDIIDYKIDKLADGLEDRPLVSGRISLRKAWIFTIFMFIISFIIAGFVSYIYSNYTSLIIIALSAISITVYDIISKKYPAMDIFVAGGIFLLILYGAFTVNMSLSLLSIIVSVLGTLQVLFMQFIAGGLKDAEHDYNANAKTLAIKLGVRVKNREMFIPNSFKILAYSLQLIYLFFLFYPFYAVFSFREKFIQIILISFLATIMIYISYLLLSQKKFFRDRVRKYIGMHYYINFSLVPLMLTSINPFIGFIALLPPLTFILSNITLHGALLPKTM